MIPVPKDNHKVSNNFDLYKWIHLSQTDFDSLFTYLNMQFTRIVNKIAGDYTRAFNSPSAEDVFSLIEQA